MMGESCVCLGSKEIADSLLKDAVLTVGVNLCLCLLFLWSQHVGSTFLAKINFWLALKVRSR